MAYVSTFFSTLYSIPGAVVFTYLLEEEKSSLHWKLSLGLKGVGPDTRG